MKNIQDIDIIIRFDGPGVRYSFDGGEKWRHIGNKWNTPDAMIRQIINRFAIYNVLNPVLEEGTSLCGICASEGRVGIRRFHRFSYGREAQAQWIYPSGDGEPYVDDVYYGCRYRVDKCDRCGDEQSDYG